VFARHPAWPGAELNLRIGGLPEEKPALLSALREILA
jgi:hypothetical protein